MTLIANVILADLDIWYLVFDTFCVLLSIIVFIILYKNYKEEMVKLRDYQNSSRRRPTGSLLFDSEH